MHANPEIFRKFDEELFSRIPFPLGLHCQTDPVARKETKLQDS